MLVTTGEFELVKKFMTHFSSFMGTVLADLKKAGEANPDDFFTLAGTTRFYELSHAWEQALTHYEKLEVIAKAPWQQVEASLGQARVLKQLGRVDDARMELKSIEEQAPRTTSTAARKILPLLPPVKAKN